MKKKIDIEKMTNEQLEQAMKTIGEKINLKLIKTKREIDDILNRYGLSIDIGFHIKNKD